MTATKNKNKNWFFFKSLFVIILFYSLFSLFLSFYNKKPLPPSSQCLPVYFFQKDSFYQAISKANEKNVPPSQKLSGGIIPHHLLADFIIAHFFKITSFQKPDIIVILGPNHWQKGNFKALTANKCWQTPFGVINPASKIIKKLEEEGLLKTNNQILTADHSIAGLLPFIKIFLPQTEIVPILISADFNFSDSQVLAEKIHSLTSSKNTLIIAAVDFSHYLKNQEKQFKKTKLLFLLFRTLIIPNFISLIMIILIVLEQWELYFC